MENNLPDLKAILDTAVALKSKHFSEFEMNVDHLTVFTYSSEQYTEFKNKADLLGVLENEDERGTMYKLNEVIESEDCPLAFFKIAKPNIHTHTNHNTLIYFRVDDFDAASRKFTSISDSAVVKSQLPNKLELLNINAKVIIAIIPITEPAIEDIEAVMQRTDQEKDVERLQSQLSEEQMKRIQVMADFQNYQRRVENDKSTWGAVSNMALIREMLEVYDDLHLALNDENLSLEHAKVSMKSAQDKLVIAVTATGVEVIDVKVGDNFDKEKMEAVSAVPAGEEQKGKVIAVISSAFKYKDKEFVLKPAKVVVGK